MKVLADETTLKDAGVVDGGELSVKDLGPQISRTTVFVVGYVSKHSYPLSGRSHFDLSSEDLSFGHSPLFYHFPQIFYGGHVQHNMMQP